MTLKDGRKAEVIDVDLERQCLWVLVDGEEHDRRLWVRELPDGVAVPAYTHADVAAAHAEGYKLGLAQKDRA